MDDAHTRKHSNLCGAAQHSNQAKVDGGETPTQISDNRESWSKREREGRRRNEKKEGEKDEENKEERQAKRETKKKLVVIE